MPHSAHPHIVLAITLAKPGGTTSFVYEYAVWLKKQGLRVTIVAGEGTWLIEQCKQAGIPCIQAPFVQREINPWRDLRAIFSLAKIFRSLTPDVIQLNSSKMGVIGSIAARIANVPRVVYFIGGWAFLESIAPWKKAFYRIAERLTAGLKDRIVCLHPGDKKIAELYAIRPRESIDVIPNGIDIAALDALRLSRAAARTELGIGEHDFVFGTIANFYPAKNLPAYLMSAAPFIKEHPTTKIVLIGDGPERAKIEAAIKTSVLGSQVLLVGAKEQAHRFLSAFDLFVLPSTKEGMPFSLLEAAAASLPCIVTDVGAHAWMLEGTTAWIIPSDNPKAIQQAMEEAFNQKAQLPEWGRAYRTAVSQRFPLNATFEQHLSVCLPHVERSVR